MACVWDSVMPKELPLIPSFDRTFLDRWTAWLATNAPRRLARTTIGEYKRQVVAFARWMDNDPCSIVRPESITSYCVEQYYATLELQVIRKTRYAQSPTLARTGPALDRLCAPPDRNGVERLDHRL